MTAFRLKIALCLRFPGPMYRALFDLLTCTELIQLYFSGDAPTSEEIAAMLGEVPC